MKNELGDVYDLIIIGCGPAGLSAALTACYLKLKHIVLEANIAGGAPIQAYPWKMVDSFLGFKDAKGSKVAKIMVEHVKKEGSEIKEGEEVKEIRKNKGVFEVLTEKSVYKARCVLIATGTIGTPRKLGIKGEANVHVHYSIRDPSEFKGKTVIVVGGGDSAVEAALALKGCGADVTLIHRRDELRASEKNKEEIKRSGIEILWNTELKEVIGDDKIEKVLLYNNKSGAVSQKKVSDVFIFIGSVLNTDFIKNLGIKMEENKVLVDRDMKTSVDGVYAAGDITGILKRIPEAIGEGHLAVYSIFKYLRQPYWAK